MKPTPPGVPLGKRALLLAASVVTLLAAVSTLTVAAAAGAFDSRSATAVSCSTPTLPGRTVTVELVDMRSLMTLGGMMGGNGAMLGQHDWRHFRPGMMRILSSPASVPAGVVSLKASNTGYLDHELVILPLAEGQQLGTRPVGSDGTVDEAGSLGEASTNCAAGEGDGIPAGSSSWVTLRLAAGRYELVCNLPGHYAAGMYAELDVS